LIGLSVLSGSHLELVPDVLLGRLGASEKEAVRARLAEGRSRLVVGTHALFQERVKFQRLGLVVIDEQHRFGVEQRAALVGKGAAPDVLLLTATPIPRSLALTRFGDLDVSVLRERPPGRACGRLAGVGVDRDAAGRRSARRRSAPRRRGANDSHGSAVGVSRCLGLQRGHRFRPAAGRVRTSIPHLLSRVVDASKPRAD